MGVVAQEVEAVALVRAQALAERLAISGPADRLRPVEVRHVAAQIHGHTVYAKLPLYPADVAQGEAFNDRVNSVSVAIKQLDRCRVKMGVVVRPQRCAGHGEGQVCLVVLAHTLRRPEDLPTPPRRHAHTARISAACRASELGLRSGCIGEDLHGFDSLRCRRHQLYSAEDPGPAHLDCGRPQRVRVGGTVAIVRVPILNADRNPGTRSRRDQ